MDELEFAASFKPSGPPTINDIFRRQLAPDWEEIEAARREREAGDARAEERETRRMLNARRGDPLGQLSRAESAAAALRDEARDLESRLEVVRGRLHQAAEAVVDFRAAADEVMSVSAQRSNTPDLLSEAKRVAAEVKVEQMLAQRSAQAARAPRRERRPFGGEVSRSHLECVYCLKEHVDPETSALLHHDPDWAVPVTTAAQAEQAEQATAERRSYSYAGEISR